VALPRIAGLPVCDACARLIRNRPFPAWIKGSFAALILLAVLAFLYNQRFFAAHVEMLRGVRELRNENLEGAVALFDAAAERVPEEPEIRAGARYFHAVLLVNQERSAEAIPLLKEALAIKTGSRWGCSCRSSSSGFLPDGHRRDAIRGHSIGASGDPPYSARSAIIGSTRVARRAGTNEAASEMIATSATTAA